MNKRVYLLLLISLISFPAFCQTKVAILPVIDKLDQVSYAHELLLRSNITTAIAMTEGYEGYDRIDLSSIMDEQDFQRKGLVSDSEIHKIGEMTGADFVIITEAAKLDDDHIIASAKIVNVESARISNSSQAVVATSNLEQLSQDCQKLTKILLGDTNSNFGTSTSSISLSKNIEREKFVDLGLSVKWAECNIGASSQEECGGYYAWGETSTKEKYTWDNYSYLYKPTSIPATNDVAHSQLGSNCRMATESEWAELKEKCKWTWTAYNGVNGYKIEADNGNYIFLPAAGFWDEHGLNRQGNMAFYWSSNLDTNDPSLAKAIAGVNSEKIVIGGLARYGGLSIRPVKDKNK